MNTTEFLTPDQSRQLRELAKCRAQMTSVIDRIVFDNQRIEGMPPLPLGLLLMAVEPEPTSEVA